MKNENLQKQLSEFKGEYPVFILATNGLYYPIDLIVEDKDCVIITTKEIIVGK